MVRDSIQFVFFGSDSFSTTVLDKLMASGLTPALIITTPETPVGRKHTLTPSQVGVWANEQGIECLSPKTLDDTSLLARLRGSEWDLFVVAVYGKKIPKPILILPKHGTLNVHPSLLPELRGPSPIKSAILSGERETGVTIMLVTEKMDAGPIVAQKSISLEAWPWPPKASSLRTLLAETGGALLAETIPRWISGTITEKEQDDKKATYSKKLTKADGLIDLGGDPYQNFLKIRAFEEWPGTYFFTKRRGKEIRVLVKSADFTDGKLLLTRVRPEGGREMSYDDFLRGAS